jgi:hypothetical protein
MGRWMDHVGTERHARPPATAGVAGGVLGVVALPHGAWCHCGADVVGERASCNCKQGESKAFIILSLLVWKTRTAHV